MNDCNDQVTDAAIRLLSRFDNYLTSRGKTIADLQDYDRFGSLAKLEKLVRAMDAAGRQDSGPLRLALKAKRAETWAKKKAKVAARTPAPRKMLSIPEQELPRSWLRALGQMRQLRETLDKGRLALDDRSPPSAKVIGNLLHTLRLYAGTCGSVAPCVLTIAGIDRFRADMFERGCKRRSIAVRLKELRLFAIWLDADEDILDHLGSLASLYQRAGEREQKNKDVFLLETGLQLSDIMPRAEEVLREAQLAPAASALRARLTLDAACLAMSVVCPLRVGDLHRITFGTHLARHTGGWALRLTLGKDGEDYHRPLLWPELTPFLDAVVMLDAAGRDLWQAYDSKAGQALFSSDGSGTPPATGWPSKVWRRHFGTGEHIVRTLWHTMMFESEDDDQWIALALAGQKNARTAIHYIHTGARTRAGRRGRALIRQARMEVQRHTGTV
ncbi:hypothetical protein [Paracoccus sp. (in: a-proteobacteria)]|uniref:hypothetical protein n=1 Tax=Paracoccus sp. TaxID=267 RepID=UPI0035AEA083